VEGAGNKTKSIGIWYKLSPASVAVLYRVSCIVLYWIQKNKQRKSVPNRLILPSQMPQCNLVAGQFSSKSVYAKCDFPGLVIPLQGFCCFSSSRGGPPVQVNFWWCRSERKPPKKKMLSRKWRKGEKKSKVLLVSVVVAINSCAMETVVVCSGWYVSVQNATRTSLVRWGLFETLLFVI